MTLEKPGIDERMASVEGDISHLSTQMTDLSKTMARGFEKLSNSSKTQWSPLVAFAALVVVLGNTYLSRLDRDIARVEAAGVASTNRCIESLEKSVEVLHREMKEKEGFAVSALMAAEAHFKVMMEGQKELMNAELRAVGK